MKTVQIYKVNDWLLVEGSNFTEAFNKAKEVFENNIQNVELVYSGDVENLETEELLIIDRITTLLESFKKEDKQERKLILSDLIRGEIDRLDSLINATIGE